MKELDISDKENLLDLNEINLRFAVQNISAKLRKNETSIIYYYNPVEVI